jgi:hydroxymethylbilane synthase
MCPAVGQGALAVETRIGENVCQALDHAATRAAVTAERAVLSSLGGGCLTPIGAHARVEGEQLRLMAIVLSADGAESVRDQADGFAGNADYIGRELGERLLRLGAARILGRTS